MGMNKTFKQTEVGPLPGDWHVSPLGSLVRSVQYGSSAKSLPSGAFPVLRMGNLQDGRVVWDDLVYTNDRTELERYRLRRGDVLFNRTNTIDLVGKTSLFASDRESLFAGYLIRVVTEPDKLDSKYLNYILNTPVAKRHSLKVLSLAVGQANINGQKLRTYPIPLPPTKAEQEAIAGALADADAWIESLEKLIAKKRQIKHSVMQQLLTGKRRLPGFSGSWRRQAIGELFQFKNGLNKAKGYFGRGTPIVNYMDVFQNRGIWSESIRGRVQVSKDELRAFEVRRGDVFFTRTSETAADIGMTAVMLDEPKSTVFSGFVLRARPKDETLLDAYKQYCFSTADVRRQITSQSTETTRALTNGRALARVTVLVPPTDEQAALASALRDFDEELVVLGEKHSKARMVKQGMMQNLLTGKVRLA